MKPGKVQCFRNLKTKNCCYLAFLMNTIICSHSLNKPIVAFPSKSTDFLSSKEAHNVFSGSFSYHAVIIRIIGFCTSFMPAQMNAVKGKGNQLKFSLKLIFCKGKRENCGFRLLDPIQTGEC